MILFLSLYSILKGVRRVEVLTDIGFLSIRELDHFERTSALSSGWMRFCAFFWMVSSNVRPERVNHRSLA